MSSFNINEVIANIRKAGADAADKAAAEAKATNKTLPVGHKLPTLVVKNHSRTSAIHSASAELIAALTAGTLQVHGVGKVLKSGDVNIRIGAPQAALVTCIQVAQEKALASRAKRKVARIRKQYPVETKNLTDTDALKFAEAVAAKVEAEKAAKAAEANKRTEVTSAPSDLSAALASLKTAA